MRKDLIALGGAIAAALAASLCCIGPLLFVVLGAGAFGAASAFEPLRPYMLSGAVLLLAYGFYHKYFRRAARSSSSSCAPGTACATTRAWGVGGVGLWLGAALVLAFALAPLYAGHLSAAFLRRDASADRPAPELATVATDENEGAVSSQPATVTVEIEGMSCVSCEAPIEAALESAQGVGRADVSYKDGTAQVEYDPQKTDVQRIKRAIESTGYKTK